MPPSGVNREVQLAFSELQKNRKETNKVTGSIEIHMYIYIYTLLYINIYIYYYTTYIYYIYSLYTSRMSVVGASSAKTSQN